MSSLVEELQKDALNHDIKITELLHKCLVVATKLKQGDLTEWIRQELDGYGEAEVPKYRELYGAVQAFNPYHGYQPVEFQNVEHAKRFSKMEFNTPVGELEHDFHSAKKSGSDTFQVSFSPEIEKMLMDAISYRLQVSLNINASQFQRVLDSVRKIVLEWSLKLEEDGITGEGVSFSAEEKHKAQNITYNVKNYIEGSIKDSQIQIEAQDSSQIQVKEFDTKKLSELTNALRSTIEALGIDETGKQELNSEITTLEAQIQSPNPKNSIIGETLTSIKRILEAASGNLIASGLLNQIGTLFGV